MSQQGPFEEWYSPTPEEVARLGARKQAAVGAAKRTPGTRTKHLRLSDDGLNEPDPVYRARQVRLLAAVKSNPAVLKQWTYDLIVSQMHQKSWSYWNMLTGGEVALQDLLAPALAALSEDDQAYFAEGATGGYFEDMIDLFSASFTITEDPPVIREQGEEA